MKPAPFEYHDPRSVEEAVGLMRQLGEDGKVLAGGQSLVPLMNFRLARPAHLVDLNRLGELDYLRPVDGWLHIGAMTRQRTLERSPLATEGWPVLVEAVRHVGHVQIRTRGTVGGSIAHADPAAELPMMATALDMHIVLRGQDGERVVDASNFFVSYLTTAARPDELLVEVRVPPLPPRSGWGFEEISRRHGDFALVGAVAVLTLGDDGRISRARLAFTGAAPTPVRARAVELDLIGQTPAETLFDETAERAVLDLEPESDIHASAEYRRDVGAVMARRALVQAAARAEAA